MKREDLDKAFRWFYEGILKDPYMASFIHSYRKVKDLVNRQIENLLYVEKLLQEDKKDEIMNKAIQIAEVHYRIKLHEFFFFKQLRTLKNLLLSYNVANGKVIDMMMDSLYKATGYVYAKNMLEEFLETVKLDEESQRILFGNLVKLKEFIEGKATEKDLILDHTECPLGKYTHTLEFLIKTHTMPDERLKFEIEHKRYHEMQGFFVSYFKKGKYEEAFTILRELFQISLHIASILKEFELNWKINSKDIFLSFLSDEFTEKVLFQVVIDNVKDSNYRNLIIGEIYERINEAFKDNGNVFPFIIDSELYICARRNRTISEGISSTLRIIVKDISERFISITERPIVSIGILDTSLIDKVSYTQLKEMLSIIKKTLSEPPENYNDVIYFKDFSEDIQDLLKKANEEVSLRKFILRSLKNKEITLFAHPIYDLEDLKAKGIEILTRLRRDNRYLSAGEFLRVVEEEGLTLDLDVAVMEKIRAVADELPEWVKEVFINVYPDSLASPYFSSQIEKTSEALKKRGVNLIVEITEHAVVVDKKVLKNLDKHSFDIAFDDFGTGYTNFERIASLAQIKRAKYLKVDGSLVKNVHTSHVHAGIVKAITIFAKEMDLKVIYEFIENKEIHSRLKKIAKEANITCYGQGYYLHKPVPLEDLPKEL